MRFSVKDSPQSIFERDYQDDVTLQNIGASTIYLANDSAVNVNTSYPLLPTGSIVWDGGRPLWAVCDSGHASTLQADLIGSLQDRAKADSWVTLAQYNPGSRGNNTTYTPAAPNPVIMECAAFQTLIVTVEPDFTPLILAGTGTICRIILTWYDQAGNSILTQSMPWTLSTQFSLPATLTVPVIGAQVRVQLRNESGATRVFNRMTVVATTNVLPTSFIPGFYASYQGTGSFGGTWRNAFISSWDLTTPLFLPSWGSKVTIGLRNSSAITAAGVLSIRDADTVAYHNQISTGTPGSSGTDYYMREVSPGRIMYLDWQSAPTTVGNINVNIYWPDS